MGRAGLPLAKLLGAQRDRVQCYNTSGGYRFSRLLPQQALGAVVHDVFAGMNRRYAERLGVSAERIEQEHRALVEAARIRSTAAHP